MLLLDALGDTHGKARLEGLIFSLLDSSAPLSLKELKVNGNDLLPLCKAQGQSPACLGEVLMQLWQRTAEQELKNEKVALLEAAEQLIGKA